MSERDVVMLGAHRVSSAVGHGPDGATWRGADADDRSVFISRLAEVGDERQWARARRLRLASIIDHPAVQAVTISLASTPPYAVMDGRGHRWSTLDPGGLDRGALRDRGAQLADGLSTLHGMGLFLGDLGPSRIATDEDGIARLDATGLRADGLDRTCDTLTRAPEVASGAFDGSADVYSLAATLAWAAYGVPDRVAEVDVEARPSLWRMALPAGDPLCDLLRAMLADVPEDRPSAARAGRILRNVSDDVPTSPDGGPADPTATTDRVDPLRPPTGTGDDLLSGVHGSPTVEISPMQRKSVGRFELGRLLGEGAMGQVYESIDPADGSRVAVKIMRAALTIEGRFRRRFDKEVRLLRSVRHARIANLVDAGVCEGLPFLALEFVPGRPLSMVVQQHRRMAPERSMRIAADVLRALSAVHASGIVHRDVKPANVMVRGEDLSTVAVLCDFGIARFMDGPDDDRITAVGSLVGTPHYMSPEQCRGQVIDGRSDLYAVGAMLYEMLIGEPPFDASNPTGILLKHIQDPVPPVSRARPDLPEPVAAWVHRMLEKDPDDRPANATAALDEVLRLLNGDPADEQLHPPLPETESHQSWVWTWDLVSPPSSLWPLISDTRRINRAMGLNPFDVELVLENGIAFHRARHRLAGLEAKWDEQPMEWIEGRRIGNLRVYEKGPLRWMRAVTDLEPLPGGGTRVTQTVQLSARYGFTRVVASYEAGVKTRKAYEQIFARMDEWLQSRVADRIETVVADPFEPAFQPSGPARTAIELAHRRLRAGPLDAMTVERLVRFVSEAPAPALNRIRPLSLARRLMTPEHDLIEACLHAVREGLLVLAWDLMCPVCRVPADIAETLAEIEAHGHCDACALDFELDFAGSVELVFRPHPSVRQIDDAMYCIGGPAQAPHIAVQLRLTPGERLAVNLNLADGTWRLAGRGLPYAAIFRVYPDADLSSWDAELGPATADALPRSLRSGRQRLVLTNTFDRDILLRIERLAETDEALTAADAMGIETFRALFPHECLAPGALVNVARITLLRTAICEMGRIYADDGPRAFARLHGHFERVRRVVSAHGGGVIKVEGDGLVSGFAEPGQAVRAAFALFDAEDDLTLRIAVNGGPAFVATLDGRLDYFGRTVHETALLLARAKPSQIVVSEPLTLEPPVARALDVRSTPEVIQLATGALALRFGKDASIGTA